MVLKKIRRSLQFNVKKCHLIDMVSIRKTVEQINSFIFATQCRRFETLYSSGIIIQDCNIKGLHSSELVQRNRLEYLSLWQKLSSKSSEHSEPGKLLTDYHIS